MLLLPNEVAAAAAPAVPVAPQAPPMPAARVVVGAVFALGLYLGLRKLAMGAVLAAHPEPDAWWLSFEGLTAVCLLQGVTVIFGAVLAAAGRVGGFVFGGIVGGVCGGLFLGAEIAAGAPPRDLVLYVQPLVLLVVGGIAGVFASRIWGAVPALDMPVPDRSTLSSSRFALGESAAPARPLSWARILVGAALMVVAVAAADQARKGIQKHSAGMLKVDTAGQGQFITWQFAVLGVLVGGGLAGATTGAGTRHGVFAGGLGGVGVLVATALHGEAFSPVSYWLRKLSLGELAPTDPAAVAAAGGGVLLLGLIGGWLGGSLFQPLAPPTRLRTGLD